MKKGIWISRDILEDRRLTLKGRFVLAVIQYMLKNGKKPYCWPKNEWLAEKVNLTLEDIEKELRFLEENGYIELGIDHDVNPPQRLIYALKDIQY